MRPTRRRRGGHHPLPVPAADPADPERARRSPELLQTRDGVDPALAAYAARVAQGHVGRARALARDETGPDTGGARCCRSRSSCRGLGGCLTAAAKLVEACAEEAAAATADARRAGAARLWRRRWGSAPRGPGPGRRRRRMKELEDQQKARAKRLQRDAIDRALTELTGFYRDLLSIQTGSGAELVNRRSPAPDHRAGPEVDPGVHAAPDRRAARLAGPRWRATWRRCWPSSRP